MVLLKYSFWRPTNTLKTWFRENIRFGELSSTINKASISQYCRLASLARMRSSGDKVCCTFTAYNVLALVFGGLVVSPHVVYLH